METSKMATIIFLSRRVDRQSSLLDEWGKELLFFFYYHPHLKERNQWFKSSSKGRAKVRAVPVSQTKPALAIGSALLTSLLVLKYIMNLTSLVNGPEKEFIIISSNSSTIA